MQTVQQEDQRQTNSKEKKMGVHQAVDYIDEDFDYLVGFI